METTPDLRILLCTAPDPATAERIAATVVGEGLAACGNRIPGVRSTYVWEGKLHDDAEVLMVFKTTAGAVEGLASRIRELHPYEVPELLVIGILAAAEAYAAWVRAAVAGPPPPPSPA